MVMFRQDGRFLGPHGLDVSLLYRELVDDTPFRDPADLLDRYTTAIAHDTATITSDDRRYWTDAPAEIAHLAHTLKTGLTALTRRQPDNLIDVHDEQRVAFTLPVQARR